MSERDQDNNEPTDERAVDEPAVDEEALEDDEPGDELDDEELEEESPDGDDETEPDDEPDAAMPAADDPNAENADKPAEAVDSTVDTVDTASGGEPEAAATEPEPDDEPEPAPAKDHGKQVANALIGVLSLVLGFALAIQVRATSSGEGLEAARQEDLVSILDDLDSREDRLRDEIASLEDSRAELASGDDKTQAALDEAQNRAEELGILAGTLPAQGPGIVLTISDPDGTVAPEVVLDAIQELRAAGAEAMQIDDVRIGVTTAFTGQKGAVAVDGMTLSPPYVILAIGEPQTLSTALSIPGGVVATVKRAGGEVTVESQDEVVVSALRPIETPEFAEPTQPTD